MFTAYERDKLLLAVAAMVARDRKSRGIKLNYPEAYSLISAQVIEWAREGASVADLMQRGATILSEADVMPGIANMIESVQVEATFADGSKLVTIHHPIRPLAGQKAKDLAVIPGQYFVDEGVIEGLANRQTTSLEVINSGDRPIQVGSHFHFFEVNEALSFDREKAYGMRLLIAPGTAVRFEPGLKYQVTLVSFGGSREVFGFNARVNGSLKN